jgi:D-tyrosyl-tRNA(Tyr) deacylase
MRALLQRVIEASAEADDRVIGRIGRGIVTLVGVAAGDGSEDSRFIAFHLRISRAPA